MIILLGIIQMGCAPPEKRHQSIPAINAVPKKAPYLSPRHSEQSKNSTQANENNLLQAPIPKLPSNESLKSQRKGPNSAGNLHKRESIKGTQRLSYEHKDSPEKPMEKEVIRIVSPHEKVKSPKKAEKQDMSKLVSVHSLDIVSRIKVPKEGQKREEKREEKKSEGKGSKVEEVNITFNHNDFAVAESKASPSFGRKRWREQALINELKGINNQNFKRIAVNSRNFN